MGYRHSRAEMLTTGATVAVEDGLRALTYRAVASRLGIPDRTVVYYFPTKDHLLTAVLDHLTDQLRQGLDDALDARPAHARDLLATAWQALATSDARPATDVLLELVGLAARGDEPYATAVSRLTTSWVSWVASRLDGAPGRRHDRAAAVIAQLDGLLVLRAVLGPEIAEAAARELAGAAVQPDHEGDAVPDSTPGGRAAEGP